MESSEDLSELLSNDLMRHFPTYFNIEAYIKSNNYENKGESNFFPDNNNFIQNLNSISIYSENNNDNNL